MANPYHAGFSGDDGRDPFGGAIKKPVGQPPLKNQDDALKAIADMMDKRVAKRR